MSEPLGYLVDPPGGPFKITLNEAGKAFIEQQLAEIAVRKAIERREKARHRANQKAIRQAFTEADYIWS